MNITEKLINELKFQEADELTLKWIPIMLKTDEQKLKMLDYLVSIRDKVVERQLIILKANQIVNEISKI